MTIETTPKASPPPKPLSDSVALLTGALGVSFFIFGTVAVFASSSETGPVALLGIGLVLFIVAIAKQIPTKLGAGTATMEFPAQEVGEAFGELAGKLSVDAAASSLEQLRAVSPEAASIAQQRAGWESMVRKMVEEAVENINADDAVGSELTVEWNVALPSRDGYGKGTRFDGVISNPAGTIAVEITNLSQSSIARRFVVWSDHVQQMNLAPPGKPGSDKKHGMLVIVPPDSHRDALDVPPTGGSLSVWVVSGPEDQDDLTEVISTTFRWMTKWF